MTAAYLAIVLHFLRETRRKLLPAARKPRPANGELRAVYITRFNSTFFPKGNVMAALCRDERAASALTLRLRNNGIGAFLTDKFPGPPPSAAHAARMGGILSHTLTVNNLGVPGLSKAFFDALRTACREINQ